MLLANLVRVTCSLRLSLQDIGTWQSVFTFITYVAIMSNAALIAFTTNTFHGPHVDRFWLFYLLQVSGRMETP